MPVKDFFNGLLSRFAGLRCPSEHMGLRWQDIDWAGGRFTVTSPKTAHHGKGSQVVPLFPELLLHLRDAFEAAEPGSEWVITRYRETNQSLRTQLNRIIKKAGLEPWAKPFQNLRATRETELMEEFPVHVVCSWIGHTLKVALEHYLQTTDEHYRLAAASDESVQKEAQRTAEEDGDERQGKTRTQPNGTKNNALPSVAMYSTELLGLAGLEPATDRL